MCMELPCVCVALHFQCYVYACIYMRRHMPDTYVARRLHYDQKQTHTYTETSLVARMLVCSSIYVCVCVYVSVCVGVFACV